MRKKTTMQITRRVAAPLLGKFERATTDPYNGLNSYTPWALESPARIVECREDRGHYLVRVEIDMPDRKSVV